MDSILVYGLGLLFYTTLKAAEDNRLAYHLNQLLYPSHSVGKPLINRNGSDSGGVTS